MEAGRTDDAGIVVLETIEAPEHPFALGVQWHPERPEMRAGPTLDAASRRLFEAFVAACVDARAKAQCLTTQPASSASRWHRTQ